MLMKSLPVKKWMKSKIRIINSIVLLEIGLLVTLLQIQPIAFPKISEDGALGMWYLVITALMGASYLNLLDLPPLTEIIQDRKQFLRIFGIFGVNLVFAILLLGQILHPSAFWIFVFLLHGAYVVFPEAANSTPESDQTSKISSEIRLFPFKWAFVKSPQSLRTILAAVGLLLGWIMWSFVTIPPANLPLSFPLFLQLFYSPLFFLGVLIALIATATKTDVLIDNLILCLLIGYWFEWYAPAPILVGYFLISIIFQWSIQPHFGNALRVAFINLLWIFSVLLYSFLWVIPYITDVLLAIIPVAMQIAIILNGIDIGTRLIYHVIQRTRQRKTPIQTQSIAESKQIRIATTPRQQILGLGLLVLLIGFPGIGFTALVFPHAHNPINYAEWDEIHVANPLGICNAGEKPEEIPYVKNLGADHVRISLEWSDVESQAGIFDFSRKDQIVDDLLAQNISILAMLYYDNDNAETHCPGVPGPTGDNTYICPADVPDFLEYVNATVNHFQGRVMAWEIWNEPNVAQFWGGTYDEFYHLTYETAKLIKTHYPNEYVIGGCVQVMDQRFLVDMLETGLQSYLDGISIHIYTTMPGGHVERIQQIHAILQKYRFDGEVWLTETGFPTGGTYATRMLIEEMGSWTMKNLVLSTVYNISHISWYTLRDFTEDYTLLNSEEYFGLYFHNFTMKTGGVAYRLFSEYCTNRTIRNHALKVTGMLGTQDITAVLYRSDYGTSSLVVWYDPTLRNRGTANIKLSGRSIPQEIQAVDVDTGMINVVQTRNMRIGGKPVIFLLNNIEAGDVLTLQIQIDSWIMVWNIGGILSGIAGLCFLVVYLGKKKLLF
jgi:hypothetical protein